MATSKTLHGSTISIPETDETDWGAEVSAYQATFAEDLEATTYQDADGNVFGRIQWTTATIAGDGELTPATEGYRLSGSGGAVTLNGTTAITDGEVDGQRLIIKGTSDTNTVRINDGANTSLNGYVILRSGEEIELTWDSTSSVWEEKTRSH